MNALSKIILVTASLHSSTILPMEQALIIPQLTDLAKENKESLTHLYSLTQHILSHSSSLECTHNVFNEKPINSLITVIAETNNLKKKHLTEKHIAHLAYTKEPSLFEHDQSFLEKFEQFVLNNNRTSNYHITIFFERLERYNNRLTKNDFTTPTLEQYTHYITNKKLETQFKKTIKKAEEFGILLNETIIHTDKPPFIHINANVATEELEKLINDIKIMCEKSAETIKYLADLLYLNN